jgi:hypothetical protein
VRVRLKSTFASPDGRTGQAGDVVDLPDDLAHSLLQADPPAAEEAPEDAAREPAPGTLTQAGSFGGTTAPLEESGQTPGVAAPAPDPLLPPEAHSDGLAVGAEGTPAVTPEVNREAIDEAADEATEDEAADNPKGAHKGTRKGKGHK